jgi:DNA-binding IclR family transcriptional regulator
LISKIEFIQRTKNTITDKNEFIKHLDQVFSQGYAVDNAESEENIKCIFAPIFNLKGEVIASIGFSGIASRVDRFNQDEIINYVIQTANSLSGMMGYLPEN